ncbi:unnamed protein product [Sphagnum balticum]
MAFSTPVQLPATTALAIPSVGCATRHPDLPIPAGGSAKERTPWLLLYRLDLRGALLLHERIQVELTIKRLFTAGSSSVQSLHRSRRVGSRSPDDDYDRYWFPLQGSNSTFLQSTNSGLQILKTNHSVLTLNGYDYAPEAVMRTALTDTSGNMTISFPDTNSYEAYLSLYFAELDPTANTTSRIFYVNVPTFGTNLVLFDSKFNTSEHTLKNIDYTNGWDINLYQDPITPSPLGPLVNALELLEVRVDQIATLTNPQDALAIEEIKSSYNLTDWTGDPCVPIPHAWVTCSFGSNSGPSITEVNLAQYNLSGPISPSFNSFLNLIQLELQNNALNGLLPLLTELTSLRTLQLQYNSLSGGLPQWLVQLPHLSELNLSGYNLTGPIPPSFGNLRNLTSLSLDYNDLNGSLPLLNRSVNLQYLLLQNNSLSGLIPEWLADLPSLSELFVWNNNFSSPIPPSILSKNPNLNFK